MKWTPERQSQQYGKSNQAVQVNVARATFNETAIGITSQESYIAGDLLWEDAIDFAHFNNIYL